MSPDHLCEEGLAHSEDIKIPFHVIFSFSTILLFLYEIHLNAHFYFFGLVIRIFSCAYQFLSEIYHVLLYWYFILRFNHCVGHQLQIPDSIQCRDHEEDPINLPVTAAPIIDTYLTLRLHVVLFKKNYLDELDSISTNISDIVYAAQNFHNPSVTVSTFHVNDTPTVYQEQKLQELLDREEHCCNFFN